MKDITLLDKKEGKEIVFEKYFDVKKEHEYSGYVVYDLGIFWEIHHFSIIDKMSRISKMFLSKNELENYSKIAMIEDGIDRGGYDRVDMQLEYDGKWYTGHDICQIQTEHQHYNWRKFCLNNEMKKFQLVYQNRVLAIVEAKHKPSVDEALRIAGINMEEIANQNGDDFWYYDQLSVQSMLRYF